MARFTIKALVITALVCLVIDLAASDNSQQTQSHEQLPTGGYAVDAAGTGSEKDTQSTSATPSTFKDKLKGFVSSVKEGAADAYESVSGSVSGAAHKVDEKRKEVVAGTKKLVNGAIDKIKSSFKHDGSEEEVPKGPESVEEQAKVAVDKTQSLLKSEKE